jgi:sialate O-acetylesterase
VYPVCLALLGWFGPAAWAEVKPHPLISDGMVLQQGLKVPIWGTAADGEQVTVDFQGQNVSTTTENGKWLLRLENLKAGGPYEMTIKGNNTVRIQNVLVGEVWVASGQSNMEWPVRASAEVKKVAETPRNSNIRLFTVPKKTAAAPQSNVQGSWEECDPQTVMNFSAVAYYFGRDLQQTLNVPVGLIHTSWGGTPAEAWTSLEALNNEPALKHYAERKARTLAEYPKQLEDYIAAVTRYKARVSQALAEGHELPPPPGQLPPPPVNPHTPSVLYNGMIASIIPYGIRGAIWYQGESNADRAFEYRTLFPTMIKNWRAEWKQGEFPFLLVQLAPFMKIEKEPQESNWAELRDAQLYTTLTVPNTAQAVIIDVGEQFDIHPPKKEPVGGRLALAARALAYGEKIEYSGPVYKSMRVDGSKAILTFDHIGGGLVAKDGPLTGFTIAGEDRKFVNADAEIKDDQVIVSSSKVDRPGAVRYGWANYPVVNLWNKDGLPASPFRTDNFPMKTEPQTRSATSANSRTR